MIPFNCKISFCRTWETLCCHKYFGNWQINYCCTKSS